MASATPKTVNYKFKWILKNATYENIVKCRASDPVKTQVFQTKFDNCVIDWFLGVYYNQEKRSIAVFFNKDNIVSNSCLLNMCVRLQGYEKKFEKVINQITSASGVGWLSFIELDNLLYDTDFNMDFDCFTFDVEVNYQRIDCNLLFISLKRFNLLKYWSLIT